MGFNRRKLEDQRREAANKEAAKRRATDPQVLEDAERLIAAWNERQALRAPMIFSPTIGAAIRAGYWFLWVRCPACQTMSAIDLRRLDRHPDAAVTSLIPALPAVHADLMRHSRNWCGYRGQASLMKCARNIGGEYLGSRGTRSTLVLRQLRDIHRDPSRLVFAERGIKYDSWHL
jgi:hypothetical protein